MTPPLMMNIQWEEVPCHLCGTRKKPRPLFHQGTPLVNGQFGYAVHPAVCSCGLVYLSPRWSREDYRIFCRYYYDGYYRLEEKPDYGKAGVTEFMKTVWERIRKHIKNAKNILDVGCGYGYGLKFLKERLPGSSIFGIESSPRCRRSMKSKAVGATLVASDFDSDWAGKWEHSFDLIIMRHVVEHMLFPLESLKKLHRVLNTGGMIYISTPDMMSPRIELRDYEHWWEYWFRPVHPYYYSQETLSRTLEKAGLYAHDAGREDAEIWGLFSPVKKSRAQEAGIYARQMAVLETLLQ